MHGYTYILRYLILFACILFLNVATSAQKKVYLNSEWKKTSRGNADYVALVTSDKAKKEYDIDVRLYPSMKPWANGRYRKKMPELAYAIGFVEWYYPSGALRQKTNFQNGLSQGDSWEYHENGEVKTARYFKDGKLEGLLLEFSDEKDTIAIKHFQNDSLHGELILYNKGHVLFKRGNYFHGKAHGRFDHYFGKDSLDCTGSYDMGKQIGTWKFYHKNGQLASLEKFENDSLIAAELFDENGAVCSLPDSLWKLSTFPRYRGGESVCMRKLRESIEYPDKAKENNVQGTVYLEFTISIDGKVLEVRQMGESVGMGLDEVALEAGKKLHDWLPGLNHNRKHPIRFVMPVKFVLR